jgi:putative peptidoglycan lipid II flippase
MAKTISENAKITKAAGVVGSATLLSRIFGFLRDVVIASFLGAGYASDAFFVAFRIPNLLRRLFAEGSLSIAFIPVFTEYIEKKGKKEAFKMAESAIRLLTLILIIVSFLGIISAPYIIQLIAPGFADNPLKMELASNLTKIVFSYIFFICLVALAMSILNVLGHFAAPAFSTVFLNLAMIASVFIGRYFDFPAEYSLAWGVIAGGALQLLLQIPFLIKKGIKFWNSISFYHPGLKKVGILMLPTIFGAAIYQINILIGTLLASTLSEGSVSYLYYADRLVQFPLGVLAIAGTTAVMPSFSRAVANNDYEELKKMFSYAMKLMLFMTLPAMAGLIILREPIVRLLFERGAFDAEAVRLTSYALLYYSIGLWAFSCVRIVVSIFYSLQDTKTPVLAGAVSIFVNIILSIILMQYLGHGGLAFATSLSSMLNLLILIIILKKRLGIFPFKDMMASIIKSSACSFFMAIGVWWAAIFLIPEKSGFSLLLGVFISIILGAGLYAGLSYIMKSKELKSILFFKKHTL